MAKEMDRRSFLKTSAVYAVSVGVPATLWGCSKNKTSTNMPSDMESKAKWDATAAQLERDGVLTNEVQGKWEGKAGSHVPQVSFNMGEGTVTLETKHGMSPEHYITAHYVRDQNNRIVGLVRYTGNESAAKSTMKLPRGTTKITAYSHCNLHDHWASGVTKIS